ncbi:signal recognition particle-docking protein FtsY [Aeoliella sp.]|uniref:signal recognition particle-docking protein FtsY n=1 Tax=Aeoliella sp. TaxID=2795800 RepID=UPI003CCC3A66
MGLFDSIKQGLKKTKQVLNTDVRDLFKSEGRLIDEHFLDDLRAILFKTDMGYEPTEELVDEVAKSMRGRVVQMEDVINVLKTKLKELMAQDESPIRFADSGPSIIMVCGVNGAGKTTSIAKLACMFRSEGKSVVLGAGDTFRAAAVEQLGIWADRLGVECVKGPEGAQPATVAYQAVEHAIKSDADVCIVDTAGRLQTQKNLMNELTKIRDSIRKQIPDAPHEVLLVLDATTGQNGISQANNFAEAAGCTGIVLAKLDGTAKGGVVVAIRQQIGLPVKYVGVGEKHEDLVLFNPDEFVDEMFDDAL